MTKTLTVFSLSFQNTFCPPFLDLSSISGKNVFLILKNDEMPDGGNVVSSSFWLPKKKNQKQQNPIQMLKIKSLVIRADLPVLCSPAFSLVFLFEHSGLSGPVRLFYLVKQIVLFLRGFSFPLTKCSVFFSSEKVWSAKDICLSHVGRTLWPSQNKL